MARGYVILGKRVIANGREYDGSELGAGMGTFPGKVVATARLLQESNR